MKKYKVLLYCENVKLKDFKRHLGERKNIIIFDSDKSYLKYLNSVVRLFDCYCTSKLLLIYSSKNNTAKALEDLIQFDMVINLENFKDKIEKRC